MKAAQQKQQQKPKPVKDCVCVWGANKSEAKKQFLLLVAAICWPTRQNSQTVERSRSAGREEEAAKSRSNYTRGAGTACLLRVCLLPQKEKKSPKKNEEKRGKPLLVIRLALTLPFPTD